MRLRIIWRQIDTNKDNLVANSISSTIIRHNTICLSECTQSYGENCQYPCSGKCINRTCNRFNGNCLCDCKHGKWCKQPVHLLGFIIDKRMKKDTVLFCYFIRTYSLRNVETNADMDVLSCTLWIVAFSISLAIHFIFISATLISRRYDD